MITTTLADTPKETIHSSRADSELGYDRNCENPHIPGKERSISLSTTILQLQRLGYLGNRTLPTWWDTIACIYTCAFFPSDSRNTALSGDSN